MRVKKREIDWVGEIKEFLVRERDVKSEKGEHEAIERERGMEETQKMEEEIEGKGCHIDGGG